MNESSLGYTGYRGNHKRNSYQFVKSSFSLKNGKKSLPEVCIDLNNPLKKSSFQKNFNALEGLKAESKRNNKGKKKQQLFLNHLYNTEIARPKQVKSSLIQYRQEIQQLKLDNEHLRQENQKLKTQISQIKVSQEYLNRRIKQIKVEAKEQLSSNREYIKQLEDKVQKFAQKIKQLYEELIKQKKVSSKYTPIIMKESSKENEPFSHRQKVISVQQKRKRLTSPSANSEHNKQNWLKIQRDNISKYEVKGQKAYYRQKQRKISIQSQY